jgi:hypothetical protein
MHGDYFPSLGCSKLVANRTTTNAHKIDVVIMGTLLTSRTRGHHRLRWREGQNATFVGHVRKVFLVRVAAIQRRASRHETEVRVLHGESWTGLVEFSMLVRAGVAISCDAQLL